jgi:hypothetical protein
MRKFGVFTSTIFLSSLLAGCYGVLHDQITFTISNEYFTKFKYIQFAINAGELGGHRIAVGIIGFLATWWMGMFIGAVLGFVGLFFTDANTMRLALQKAVLVVILTASLFAVIGFIYGNFYLTKSGVDWWLPEDLADKKSFIAVGSVHNFSYLGGVIGLLIAVGYLIRGLYYQSKT